MKTLPGKNLLTIRRPDGFSKNCKHKNKSNNHQCRSYFRTSNNFVYSLKCHFSLSSINAKYNDSTQSNILLNNSAGENGKKANGIAKKYAADKFTKNDDMTLKSEDINNTLPKNA